MGREIRRVIPNWDHPKISKPQWSIQTHRLEMVETYQPMRDRDVESAWKEWQEEYDKWLASEHDKVVAEHGATDYPKNEPYRAFCKWHGEPPNPAYYRPKWRKQDMTWWQVYETVSEGTPVTPAFATAEELIAYLVANGDFWDQNRRAKGITDMDCSPWTREQAERFVNRGWASSLMVEQTPEGSVIKEPKHQ